MRTWTCPNCGQEYTEIQPRNRCAVCGMHLEPHQFCDWSSCGVELLGRVVWTTDGRSLCEGHLVDVLEASVAMEVTA